MRALVNFAEESAEGLTLRNRFLVALVLVAAWGMHSFAHAQLFVAHRGASFDAPENTLAAFKLAWEQGADAIEADFRLTADRRIVCIHDQTTRRINIENMVVKETSYSVLKQLDVGTWKHRHFSTEHIPTIEAVLNTVPEGKLIYIELKSGPEIIRPLEKVLKASHLKPKQTVIISFKRDVVRLCKQLMPERKAYWLVAFPHEKEPYKWQPTATEMIRKAKEINADGLDIEINEAKAAKTFAVVNQQFATAAREADLTLHAWTVDKPELARRLIAMGFSSITTNRPALFMKGKKARLLPNTQNERGGKTPSEESTERAQQVSAHSNN